MSFSVIGKRVVVFGAGRSGRAAARLLVAKGARVTLTDTDPHALDEVDLSAEGMRVDLGPHRPGLAAGADLVVVSPGVPPDQEAISAARRQGVPVVGEIELASRWLTGRIVAITGTKGKSTTTSLAARMLAEGGFDVTAGGNIGTALSEQVSHSHTGAIHVVEVSSFQLETTDTFHPWIAVLLNLSPDHLDRHASFGEYAAAKARIFRNQTPGDWAVVNADDPGAMDLSRGTAARRFDFALATDLVDGVTVEGDDVVVRGAGVGRPLMPLKSVRVPGRHLLADVLAASAVGVVAGVPPDAIERAVGTFAGLEHALELVGDVEGVRFVNDSKATNVLSARRSIESFDGGVIAIMGGRYKGGAFEELRDVVAERADGVVAIGEAAGRIDAALGDVVPVHRAASLDDAVDRAFTLAAPGGVVLLAPGCSSFDMFKDYRERGQAFKHAVARLKGTRTGRAEGRGKGKGEKVGERGKGRGKGKG
jgi:UDP-N-acetylmuramoylalanine--D-glutamate ligase